MDIVLDFFAQVFRGKTIHRILFNRQVYKRMQGYSGVGVDLAGGGVTSYYPYLPPSLQITKTNRHAGVGIDVVADLEQPLPFPDASFDVALFFNALYILKDRVRTLREIRRILQANGTLFLSSPFIANEMPEPHDYARLTREGLQTELAEAGFSKVEVYSYGERFTAAAHLLHSFFIFDIVRCIVFAVALGLDRCIPRRMKAHHPAPLGYFCIVNR